MTGKHRMPMRRRVLRCGRGLMAPQVKVAAGADQPSNAARHGSQHEGHVAEATVRLATRLHPPKP
jgi:hypothetical protein